MTHALIVHRSLLLLLLPGVALCWIIWLKNLSESEKLRLGVRNAIGGVGLDPLGVGEWWNEDSILVAGDDVILREILREVEKLAIQCEHDVSGERKLAIQSIQAYVKRNRCVFISVGCVWIFFATCHISHGY